MNFGRVQVNGCLEEENVDGIVDGEEHLRCPWTGLKHTVSDSAASLRASPLLRHLPNGRD